MAGSMTWREYIADDGNTYSIKVDESNANCTVTSGTSGATTTALCKVRTQNWPPLPKGMRPRYSHAYFKGNYKITKNFIVGDPAMIPAINTVGATGTTDVYPAPGGLTGPSVGWLMGNVKGEKSRKPAPFDALDSGLTDGTATQ